MVPYLLDVPSVSNYKLIGTGIRISEKTVVYLTALQLALGKAMYACVVVVVIMIISSTTTTQSELLMAAMTPS